MDTQEDRDRDMRDTDCTDPLCKNLTCTDPEHEPNTSGQRYYARLVKSTDIIVARYERIVERLGEVGDDRGLVEYKTLLHRARTEFYAALAMFKTTLDIRDQKLSEDGLVVRAYIVLSQP